MSAWNVSGVKADSTLLMTLISSIRFLSYGSCKFRIEKDINMSVTNKLSINLSNLILSYSDQDKTGKHLI